MTMFLLQLTIFVIKFKNLVKKKLFFQVPGKFSKLQKLLLKIFRLSKNKFHTTLTTRKKSLAHKKFQLTFCQTHCKLIWKKSYEPVN
jgi:hypothetical protein